MRHKSTLSAFFTACFVLLTSYQAQAVDGTITGAVAQPPQAFVDTGIVVEIQGTEVCDKLQVDFGDGSPPVEMLKVEFKNDKNTTSPPHPYSDAGNYTITIAPVEKCNGQATATVQINLHADVDTLRQMMCAVLGNCDPGGQAELTGIAAAKIAARLPHIEAMFPGPIKPGADVLVLGRNFGDNTTQLRMRLKGSNKTWVLDKIDRSTTFFAASIPSTIMNVNDQPSEFFLVLGSGLESNKFQVGFTAARQVKQLPAADVTVSSCGNDSNCDICNGKLGSGDEPGCNTMASGYTLSGRHHNIQYAVGDDTGSDSYKMSLANNWVFDSYDAELMTSDPGDSSEASVSGPTGFSSGAASWSPSFQWMASPADGVYYRLKVFIKGPKGISHK